MDTTNLIQRQPTYPSIIGDANMTSDFLSWLPDLDMDQVYFASLSARNKYLSDYEREKFDLGRTEMFSRHIAYDRDDVADTLNRMYGDLHGRRTRNGSPIPHKCLVVYINIHAMSTIKAYNNFVEEMNRHQAESINALMNDNTPNMTGFTTMPTRLMNHIQKATGTKKYLDVDIDAPKWLADSILEHIQESLFGHGISHLVISTQGGYHVMVETAKLKDHKDFQLHDLVRALNNDAEEEGGEVCFNTNAMVPLPGTYQAGHLVTFEAY